MVEIAPSILSANFSILHDELQSLTQAGANRIHLDVMDGHYVPNLTFGAPVIKSIRSCTNLPFDVHLMIQPVFPLLDSFIEAGADIILFHPDSHPHIHRTIAHIKQCGKKVGLVLNPSQSIDLLLQVLEDLDQVLIMTVNPGFGGQKFIPSQIAKISQLKALRTRMNLDFKIEVDGGITTDNALLCIEAGADILVAGTSIFKDGAQFYQQHIQALRGI